MFITGSGRALKGRGQVGGTSARSGGGWPRSRPAAAAGRPRCSSPVSSCRPPAANSGACGTKVVGGPCQPGGGLSSGPRAGLTRSWRGEPVRAGALDADHFGGELEEGPAGFGGHPGFGASEQGGHEVAQRPSEQHAMAGEVQPDSRESCSGHPGRARRSRAGWLVNDAPLPAAVFDRATPAWVADSTGLSGWGDTGRHEAGQALAGGPDVSPGPGG